MLTERDINENNLVYVFNDLSYGKQFLEDYKKNYELADINIIFGMIPYLLMIYFSTLDFFKAHHITIGNSNNLYDSFYDSLLDDERSKAIKLYSDNNSWKKNSKHIQELNKNQLNYCIYLNNGKIVNNTHLRFKKQFNCSNDVYDFFKRLLSKFYLVRQFNQEWLCKLDNFNFDFQTDEILVNNINYKDYDYNCVIALLDVLSTLNFYYLYLRKNAIDKVMDLKIKYQVFVNSINSILNLNENISQNKLLNNEELLELNNIKNCFIKSSLVNKTKHGNYIDRYTSVQNIAQYQEKSESIFVKMVEKISKYDYNDYSIKIEKAIKQIIDILEKHILIKENNIYFI